MDTASLLVKAMAEECRGLILEWNKPELDLPEALQRKHLERMCDRIEQHAEDWSTARLNRWIGFVQCAMMANRILDIDAIKEMFDKVKALLSLILGERVSSGYGVHARVRRARDAGASRRHHGFR
jgi:hypothetical protein